jgi:hypothetical protein
MVVRLAQDGVKAIDLLTPAIRDRGSQRCRGSAQRQRQAMTSGINDPIHTRRHSDVGGIPPVAKLDTAPGFGP